MRRNVQFRMSGPRGPYVVMFAPRENGGIRVFHGVGQAISCDRWLVPLRTPLPKKLGINPGSKVAVVDPPPGVGDILASWPEEAELVSVASHADVVLFFVKDLAALESRYAALGEAIRPDGNLWICWPKQASGVPTDVTDNAIRDLLLPSGLVDTKVCSIDETWSGLRFVWRQALR